MQSSHHMLELSLSYLSEHFAKSLVKDRLVNNRLKPLFPATWERVSMGGIPAIPNQILLIQWEPPVLKTVRSLFCCVLVVLLIVLSISVTFWAYRGGCYSYPNFTKQLPPRDRQLLRGPFQSQTGTTMIAFYLQSILGVMSKYSYAASLNITSTLDSHSRLYYIIYLFIYCVHSVWSR